MEYLSCVKDIFNIIFFIGMPTIAALALYQANRTILAPRHQEYFKRQLDAYTQLSGELFFRESDDFIRTLKIDKIAESTGLRMYDTYLYANKYEASDLQDLIQRKKDITRTQKMENEAPSIGCGYSQEDIVIREDSSEEEIAEYQKFCDNPNEYPKDLVTINYLVLPKEFVDKRDALLKLSDSIFIDSEVQVEIRELIDTINECYEYLYIGAKAAGKKINGIHSEKGMHGMKFGVKTKSRMISELIMLELNKSSFSNKLAMKAQQIKVNIEAQVKKQILE